MNDVATVAPGGEARHGDWMITYTGRRFWPLSPRPEDVDFRDVAHGLSNLCRYGGHVRCFYSVAEHSNLLAMHFLEAGREDLARYALLHDAAEAYVGDIIRPLKPELARFKEIEKPIERAVLLAAGLEPEIPPEVHAADGAIIGEEARKLFSPDVLAAADWVPLGRLKISEIMGWVPNYAEQEFLILFDKLFPELAQ